jgi:DNA-binding NtrC family response regulator
LITGESGTGKTALAEFIHQKSKRNFRDLVKIDCAALPRDLLEAELFGFEKGAFTGATETKTGRLEAAHETTLLLDEIALVPIETQAKLLRVLEQREFERLGGRRTIKLDIRLIAATNADLEQAVKEKKFREDLFFRLNVVRIALPPLREQREDLEVLAESFLQNFAAKQERPNLKLSDEALAILKNYDFPGNLRELSNLIERAAISANGDEIKAADFPSFLRDGSVVKKWLTLADVEKKHVLETLNFAGGNKTEAARLLGISRKNLYEKLARYELKI